MLAEITDCNFTELIETIEPDVLIGMSTDRCTDKSVIWKFEDT